MEVDILWEGKTSINNFHFNFSTEYNYITPEKEIPLIKQLWKSEKEEYPQIYNGDLIYIDSMDINSTFNFNVGIIQFADLLYLARNNQSLKDTRGYLSFKIILYYNNKNSRRYLVGIKSSGSQFDPDNWTMTGGVMEVKDEDAVDLFYSIRKEISEETGLITIENDISCHLMAKDRRNLGIGLILSLEIDFEKSKLIRENIEFEPSSFSWLNDEEILALNDTTILDDVAALKYIIQNRLL